MSKTITSIRFNKVLRGDDIYSTTYIVGRPFWKQGMKEALNVVSIDYVNKVKKDRLVTTFSNGSQHEIGITADVEMFFDEIEKPTKVKNDKP